MGQVDGARDEQFRAYVVEARGRLLRSATLLSSGDPFQAEDLVQTVLLRMYLSWPRIRPESRHAYAYRSLVNAHHDAQRRPHTRKEQNKADVPEVAAAEQVAPSDTDTAVFRALAQLPAKMRAAVVLRHVLDISVADAAKALDCSEGTVKSQTARGLAQLRTALFNDAAESARPSAPISDHTSARKANQDDRR